MVSGVLPLAARLPSVMLPGERQQRLADVTRAGIGVTSNVPVGHDRQNGQESGRLPNIEDTGLTGVLRGQGLIRTEH